MSLANRCFVRLPLLALAVPSWGQESAEAAEAFMSFALALEESIAEADPELFDSRFDLEAVLEQSAVGIEVPRGLVIEFFEGVRSTFSSLAEPIIASNLDYDGTYRFLRMLPGETPRALFRFAGDDGLNYHELFLRRDDEGAVRIVDYMDYLTGQSLSEIFHASLLSLAADRNAGTSPADSKYVSSLAKIAALVEAAETDPARCLKIYATLPKEVRYRVEILMLRVVAASEVSDAAYEKALDDVEKHFPDSPTIDLVLINSELFKERYDAALARIDSLDKLVLGDPYLDVLRSDILLIAGRPGEARESALRAAKRDPTLDYEATWALLDVAVTTGDHAETLKLLLKLEEDYEVEFEELSEVEVYADFVASAEYERWLSR